MNPDETLDADSNGLIPDEFSEVPDDAGVSLEELSQTYAELITGGADPYDAVASEPDESEGGESEQEELPDEPDEGADTGGISPQTILEAMLFVGHPENKPLSSKQVASLMRGVRPGEIDTLVGELNEAYTAEGCPYWITSSGDGYRMELRPDFSSVRDTFYGRVKEARLSQGAIDVLAVIAWNQGLTREEVDKLRDRSSGSILSQLVRRELLRIERSDGKPRVVRYFTTDRFLELFRLDSLESLPQTHDLDRFF